jgi:hypothetical protein
MWARYRLGTYPGGAFRQVQELRQTVSGMPTVEIDFETGPMVKTTADSMWEVDE